MGVLRQRVRDALETVAEYVPEGAAARRPLQPLLENSGKGLRPSVVFLAARAGSLTYDSKVDSAAVLVEILHIASLVHDDVADGAVERRGVASINACSNIKVATWAGTWLFLQVLPLARTLGKPVEATVAETARTLSTAQIAELECAFDLEVPIDHYLEVCAGKTAELFALAARLGAMLSGARPTAVAALEAYGRALGVAYQIVDDITDYTSCIDDARTVIDLARGQYGIPLRLAAHAHDLGGQQLANILATDQLTEDHAAQVLTIVRQSRGCVEAIELARALTKKACQHLRSAVGPDCAQPLVEIGSRLVGVSESVGTVR